MKKILILFIFTFAFACAGCGDVNPDYISEVTKIYFAGQNENISVSIATGKREEPYIMDGIHGNMVDFSLVTLKCEDNLASDEISAEIEVNGIAQAYILQLNPLNFTYMCDMGIALNKEDVLIFKYSGHKINLAPICDEFEVGFEEAIKMGESNIEGYANISKSGGYEGYLKIIDGEKFGGEGLYWIYTILQEDGHSQNVLISVYDKNIVFCG